MRPDQEFESPEQLLASDQRSREQKIQALRQWEQDARQLSVAQGEGMEGPHADLLRRVRLALQQLEMADEGAPPSARPPTALELADDPATCLGDQDTLARALEVLAADRPGAIAVVDEQGQLSGIFTEHDAVRCLAAGEQDRSVPIREIMSAPVATVRMDTPRKEVLRALTHSGYRYLPVCAPDGSVKGMVSGNSLLRREVDRLHDELDSLENFLTADGPGG